MRVALLTYSTRPRGGVVHTLALAEALTRHGVEVDVWSLARGGDAAFFRPVDPEVGVRLVPFPARDGEAVGDRIVRSIAVLRDAFRDRDYDVVHAQDCISANAVDRPVRTVHHLDAFTTPQLVACHERALRDPVRHLAVSRAVAAELRTTRGIRATVVPNGVDAARFAAAAGPDAAATAARAARRDELGPYVLAVGGIEPRKGTADLVTAMGTVQRSRPDLALVIAGGETLFDYRGYRAEVLSLADRLGVRMSVLGPVPDPDLPSLVAAARVFAFPSTAEGFGLAAMEALAADVPLVCRDLPVLREVFGGAARFASDPAAFAAELLDATDAAETPGANATAERAAGRALAARHTWDAAAAAHVAVYRDLPARDLPRRARSARPDRPVRSVA